MGVKTLLLGIFSHCVGCCRSLVCNWGQSGPEGRSVPCLHVPYSWIHTCTEVQTSLLSPKITVSGLALPHMYTGILHSPQHYSSVLRLSLYCLKDFSTVAFKKTVCKSQTGIRHSCSYQCLKTQGWTSSQEQTCTSDQNSLSDDFKNQERGVWEGW